MRQDSTTERQQAVQEQVRAADEERPKEEMPGAMQAGARRYPEPPFPDQELEPIPPEHPVFHTVADIDKLKLAHDAPDAALAGLTLGDKTVLIYSRHGLNDTAHTEGCCCCGGNEIQNSLEVNINILAYALLH